MVVSSVGWHSFQVRKRYLPNHGTSLLVSNSAAMLEVPVCASVDVESRIEQEECEYARD